MSDLFRAKVVSRIDDTQFEPGPVVADQTQRSGFASMVYDFAEIAGEAFESDASQLSLEEFWACAKEFADEKSFEQVSEALGYTIAFNPSFVEKLANDPTSIEPDEIDLARWHWLGHSVLAELYPDAIEPLVTAKVTFDVAQIHPDAGVPYDDLYLAPFVLRLLAEASGDMFDNPIWEWFDQIESEALLTLPYPADDALHGIVFGCGVEERTSIATGDQFAVGHENAWWATDERVRQLLSQGPLEEGFEAVRLWIRVVPGWISRLQDGVFDSRAY